MMKVKPKLNFNTVRPINDMVLIKVDGMDQKTKGGIYIPETAEQRVFTGKVIAIGEGEVLKDGSFRKCPVKPGSEVVYSPYAGTEVEFENEGGNFILVKQSCIWMETNYKKDTIPPKPEPPKSKILKEDRKCHIEPGPLY